MNTRGSFAYDFDTEDFKSIPHDVGHFNLSAHNNTSQCSDLAEGYQCMILVAQPRNGDDVTIWKCLVSASLAMKNESEQKEVIFAQANDMLSTKSSGFHIHWPKTSQERAAEKAGKGATGSVLIEIYKASVAQLSHAVNSLVKNDQDVARFNVGGKELFLSKHVLRFHSVYFDGLFHKKHPAEEPYVIASTKLSEFLHFLMLLHGWDIDLSLNSVEYLLQLADTFRCSTVLKLCSDFLRSDRTIPLMQKVRLADTYKLHRVVVEAIQNSTAEEWKWASKKTELSVTTKDLIDQKLSLC